jgi:hypothetical protein
MMSFTDNMIPGIQPLTDKAGAPAWALRGNRG